MTFEPDFIPVNNWLQWPGQPAYWIGSHCEISDGNVTLFTITHTQRLVLGTELDALSELIGDQTRTFKQLCQMASKLYII